MSTKWYRLLDDIHYPNRWQLNEPMAEDDGEDVEAWEFTMARPWETERSLIVTADPGEPLDFTLGALGVPFLSSELAKVFGQVASRDVQLIPVHVDRRKLYILNATRLVDCLDENGSEFIKWGPQDGRPDKVGYYRMVPNLRVDTKRAGRSGVLRVKGWDVALIVSEEIKDAIEEKKFTGAIFEPVS